MNGKLQDHKRWSLFSVCTVFLISASLINLAHAPKTHAIDILQPVTSILNSLLAPSQQPNSPDAPDRTPSNPPSQASPRPQQSNQTAQPQAEQESSATQSQPSSTSTEPGYVPLESELEPVVLGTNAEEPRRSEDLLTPEPPALAQSIARVEQSKPEPEKCGGFFGMCWYWWIPIAAGVTGMTFLGFRMRHVSKAH